MEKNKQTKIKKGYLVIGSNNFWYASCDTLEEAKQIKREVMKEPKDEVNYNYGNEESNPTHHPFSPDNIYIYESTEIEN
jgi:phage-related protein